MTAGRRERADRGASTIEFVLTLPILLLSLLLTVQFALIAHAQNGLQAAAEEGASQARAYNGTIEGAEARARRYVHELSGAMFTSTTVRVHRSGQRASVTVAGTVTQIVPGIPTDIQRTSTGPVERFVQEPG